MMRIEQLVERVDRLPVMAPIHARLMRMVRDAQVSAPELSEAISSDPSLTAQVLRLANSAARGVPGGVRTVSHAVRVLGFETIAKQVLAPALRVLKGPAESVGPLDFGAFWRHSVAVAAGARVLARRLSHHDDEALFVAGLLHDIGRLVMAQRVPEALASAMDLAWRLRVPLVAAERTTIGFTHCRVGEGVATRWDLPDLVVDAVAFHHEPDLTERHSVETRIVQVSDVLAKAMSLGYSGDDRPGPIPVATVERLCLEADQIEETMEAIRAEFDQVSGSVRGSLEDEATLFVAESDKEAAKTADNVGSW
jgi:putative nucleotidyltransferase with HDIG domain